MHPRPGSCVLDTVEGVIYYLEGRADKPTKRSFLEWFLVDKDGKRVLEENGEPRIVRREEITFKYEVKGPKRRYRLLTNR